MRHSRGTRYSGADCRVDGVVGELLAHHPSRRAFRQTQPPAERNAALEAVAVRDSLVRLAVEVPRLMGEHGDRTRGLAERALVVLVLEPVEPVADVGRQVGVPAADLGDPVGVLDDADRLASGVAVNDRCVPGDPCRLGREQRLGLRLVGLVEPVPASVGDEHEEHERERRRPPRLPRAGRAGAGGAGTGAAGGCGQRLWAGSPWRSRSRLSSINSSTSSSLLPPAGIQTSCPSIRTSIGSSHPSPPNSSMSEVCGIRPRVVGTCGSRKPAMRKFSSSAA